MCARRCTFVDANERRARLPSRRVIRIAPPGAPFPRRARRVSPARPARPRAPLRRSAPGMRVGAVARALVPSPRIVIIPAPRARCLRRTSSPTRPPRPWARSRARASSPSPGPSRGGSSDPSGARRAAACPGPSATDAAAEARRGALPSSPPSTNTPPPPPPPPTTNPPTPRTPRREKNPRRPPPRVRTRLSCPRGIRRRRSAGRRSRTAGGAAGGGGCGARRARGRAWRTIGSTAPRRTRGGGPGGSGETRRSPRDGNPRGTSDSRARDVHMITQDGWRERFLRGEREYSDRERESSLRRWCRRYDDVLSKVYSDGAAP